MKRIKLKICNHQEDNPFSYGHFLLNILRKYYDVEMSEKPEYVIFNESTYEHLKYDGIKIFYTGENVAPNFNFCDYAIGFDWMEFGDRHYRLPLYLLARVYQPKELEQAKNIDFAKQLSFTREDLAKKTDFCSYVYSNYLADPERKEFFNKLSTYKKVNAGGRCDNNVGGRVDNKLAFEMKHKFSIAFENSSRSGYTTEKLVTSIMAQTVPIYWGNPDIGREFNTKRFINCHDYASFEEVIERVKEVDQNDDLYLQIINEPVTVPEYNFNKVLADFEIFLRHIIDQPLEKARRICLSKAREVILHRHAQVAARYVARHVFFTTTLSTFYRLFKKLPGLEKLKQIYFNRIK